MNASPIKRIFLVCLLGAGPVHAAGPSPGHYLAEGGRGDLEIKPAGDKSLRFRLTATGENGHGCDLRGTIKDGRAVLPTGNEGKACTVVFSAAPGSVHVESIDNSGACRDFCGARAWFDGTYLFAARCTRAAKSAARQRFGALYRAGSYARALAELAPVLDECRTVLHWMDAARLRNDIAITQYHLGQLSECRNTLAPVLEYAEGGERQLRNALPPADFERFLPVAKAAWHNASLCQAGTE